MQNNIKKIREQRGYSQGKLATIMGIDKRYIERYETYTDIKLSAAIDLCVALKCTLKDLFEDDRLEFGDLEKSIDPAGLLRFVRLSANVSLPVICAVLGISETQYRNIENKTNLTISDTLQIVSAIMSCYQSRHIFQQSNFYNGTEKDDEQLLLEAYRSVVPSQKKQLLQIVNSFLPQVKNSTKDKNVG